MLYDVQRGKFTFILSCFRLKNCPEPQNHRRYYWHVHTMYGLNPCVTVLYPHVHSAHNPDPAFGRSTQRTGLEPWYWSHMTLTVVASRVVGWQELGRICDTIRWRRRRQQQQQQQQYVIGCKRQLDSAVVRSQCTVVNELGALTLTSHQTCSAYRKWAFVRCGLKTGRWLA